LHKNQKITKTNNNNNNNNKAREKGAESPNNMESADHKMEAVGPCSKR